MGETRRWCRWHPLRSVVNPINSFFLSSHTWPLVHSILKNTHFPSYPFAYSRLRPRFPERAGVGMVDNSSFHGWFGGMDQRFKYLWPSGSPTAPGISPHACLQPAVFIVGSFIVPVNRPILGTCYWEGGERGRKSVTTWRTLREELENSNQTLIMLLMHGALFSFLLCLYPHVLSSWSLAAPLKLPVFLFLIFLQSSLFFLPLTHPQIQDSMERTTHFSNPCCLRPSWCF